MLAQLLSSTLCGIESHLVRVEVDVGNGLPKYRIVGLPDASVAESEARVQAALKHCGLAAGRRRITVNLAPGDLRKEGPRFDLPIALGILVATGQLSPAAVASLMVLGELALDGCCRPVSGVLSATLEARAAGCSGILVPAANLGEAGLVTGIAAYGAHNLRHAVRLLLGQDTNPTVTAVEHRPPAGPDLLEVRGQRRGKRALEIAASGGHHLMMVGPPGCGKSLLARCLPSLLPPLTSDESLEITQIESVCSGVPLEAPIRDRPFRAPSAGASVVGILGGRMPGEVTRAHLGVLFLDEFPEFARNVTESLRGPLDTGYVEIVRARFRNRYPARFTLTAAMNPCPCGYFGDPLRECICTETARLKYLGRFSGPLRDRTDLHVSVQRPDTRDLLEPTELESCDTVRGRVLRARAFQLERGHLNRDLQAAELWRCFSADREGRRFLSRLIEHLGLSVRAQARLARVARTIADLRGADKVELSDLAEALEFRFLDRPQAA
ncbi:MAG: YifB family Mg chelatase-like AAA ATPase [Armatimonadetes bacterium]|nr:YifB family Mg chelatase-like AAA ATPase [Armatimonadota bacterium]